MSFFLFFFLSAKRVLATVACLWESTNYVLTHSDAWFSFLSVERLVATVGRKEKHELCFDTQTNVVFLSSFIFLLLLN